MRGANADIAQNKPVTLHRNQLLIRYVITSTLSRCGVTLRANVTSVYAALDSCQCCNVFGDAEKRLEQFRHDGPYSSRQNVLRTVHTNIEISGVGFIKFVSSAYFKCPKACSVFKWLQELQVK
jgi:hypothetical protein